MTTDDLARIEARAASATPGPWTTEQFLPEDRPYPEATNIAGDRKGVYWQVATNLWCADAEFIAHAREDVPALIAALRDARAALARVEALCEESIYADTILAGLIRAAIKGEL
jgi:hypothetical protein